MIITPSAVPPRTMTSASLFRMPLSADQRANRPGGAASSEWRLHRDILRARPEAGAVVHCHAPHATALSLLRKPLPAAHYMIALMGGEVRCSAYAPFGSQELSDLAVAALEGRFAALLGNHGSVTIGVDLDEALSRAAELENLARIYLLALAAGEPVLLSQEQVAEAVSLFAAYRRPEPR
jgi:L-fuculose-phosphate aldolase